MMALLSQSLAEDVAQLACSVQSAWAWPNAEAGFAWHLYHAAGEGGPTPSLSEATWPTGPLHHAPNLAAAGYLLALGAEGAMPHRAEWDAALRRFSSTDPFPADRQSFAFRPIELLGISLGAEACVPSTAAAHQWLASVVRKLEKSYCPPDPWTCLLSGLAARALGTEWSPRPHAALEHWEPADLALAAWIERQFSGTEIHRTITAFSTKPDELLLRTLALQPFTPPDLARAAICHHSLRRVVSERIGSALADTWQVNREQTDALAIVLSACRRFHVFARQLLERRENRATLEISDEYDVQDVLHALLRLHFDDVRAEEWTPSYAGVHSRMDFLLKREKLVVEAKMTSERLGQKEVVNQLAVDKERYRSHPDCQTLVCFVYDPALKCHNPSALETDASEAPKSGLRTVVVVGPRGS